MDYVCEGDTILLSYELKDKKCFLHSLQPIKKLEDSVLPDEALVAFQATIHPLSKDERNKRLVPPNIQYLSFKVLPELSEDTPPPVSKDKICPIKLVYGRKIKLFHVASKMYLSLSSTSDESKKYISLRPKFDESCLFLVYPPNMEKTIGDAIVPGDVIFLKSTSQSYITVSEDEKLVESMSIDDSIGFTIYLHQSVKANNSFISGGNVVRLSFPDNDAHLCGQGSTLAGVWAKGLEHFEYQFKVGCTRKRMLSTGVHRPPPVSGDCYWQIEKWNNPLDGSYFKYGDECSLRHLQTQRYLAMNPITKEFELILVDGTQSEGYQYRFTIRPNDGDISRNEEVNQNAEIKLEIAPGSIFLSLDTERKPEAFREIKKKNVGTQWINVKSDTSDDHASKRNTIKIERVNKALLDLFYFAESVKNILNERLPKKPTGGGGLEGHVTPVTAIDPSESEKIIVYVLKCVSEWLRKGSFEFVSRKTPEKVLRSSEVVALLVNSLYFDPSDDVCTEISNVLVEFIKIYSHRSHLYFIQKSTVGDSKSLVDVLVSQLGKFKEVIYHLLERQSHVAETVALSLLKSEFLHIIKWPLKITDSKIIKIFSMLCLPNKIPLEKMQNYICTELKKKCNDHEMPLFRIEGQSLMYISQDEQEAVEAVEIFLTDDTKHEVNYLVALLELFANLCKGTSETSSEFKEYFPFEPECLAPDGCLKYENVKSAYLKYLVSAYIEPLINEGGVDIDNIWHCYLMSRIKSKDSKSSQASESQDSGAKYLYASNVSRNISKKLKYGKGIMLVLNEYTAQQEGEEKVGDVEETAMQEGRPDRTEDENNFISDLMEVLKLLVNYGVCWNDVNDKMPAQKLISFYSENNDDEYVLINLPHLIKMLQLKTDEEFKKYMSPFRLRVKIIEVLHVFLKQLVYLALERFIVCYRKSKDESLNERQNFDASGVMQNFFSVFEQSGVDNYLLLEQYNCFDIRTKEGHALVNALNGIIEHESSITISPYCGNELRDASAALLHDIYNKEELMLKSAKNSYLVFHEDPFATDYIKLGAFVGLGSEKRKPLQALMNGFGTTLEITDGNDNSVLVYLELLCDAMKKRRFQMLAFTSGIYSALMIYVLRFSSRVQHVNKDQPKLLKQSFVLLKLMCRENDKVKEEVFSKIPQLLQVRTGVSEAAHLIAEVFDNNRKLCERMKEHNIEHMYILASTYLSDNDEYVEFFKALAVLMKPDTGPCIHVHQKCLFQLFWNTHDHFSDVLSISDETTMSILTEPEKKHQKNKLLLLVNFIAACCESYQFAKEKSSELYSLSQLIDIISNENITEDDCRKPFVCFLVQVYLCNRRQLRSPVRDSSNVEVLVTSLRECISQLSNSKDIEEKQLFKDDDKDLKKLFQYSIHGKKTPEVCEDEGTEKEENETWQRVVSTANEGKEVLRLAPASDMRADRLLELWSTKLQLNVEVFKNELEGIKEERIIIMEKAPETFFQIFGVLHQYILKLNEDQSGGQNLQFLRSFAPKFLRSFPPADVERLFTLEKESIMHILAFFAIFFLYNDVDQKNDPEETFKANKIIEIRRIAMESRNFFSIVGRQIQRATYSFDVNVTIPIPSDETPKPATTITTDQQTSINETGQELEEVHIDPCDRVKVVPEIIETDSLWDAGIALDVISAMCSEKDYEMQNRMREEHLTGNNFVRDTAVLLYKLANTSHNGLIECKTKAIQALIDMCNGNIENQKEALNGQVMDSINLILSNHFEEENIKEQILQAKSIKLLQILLEETCKGSRNIIEIVCMNLRKHLVAKFITKVFTIYKFDHSDDSQIHDLSSTPSIMRQALLRAYHVLKTVEDHDKSFQLIEKEWSWDNRNYLDDRTRRIEVFYDNPEDKEEGILTRVYFPFDPQLEFTESEKDKFKRKVNREDLEDRQENLIFWTKSAKKNFSLKSKLKKRFLLYDLFYGFPSKLFDVSLILLTILLNLLILSIYVVPDSVIAEQAMNSSIVVITSPQLRVSSYKYWRLFFAIPHVILALWMVLHYFITQFKNFIVIPYGFRNFCFDVEMSIKRHLRPIYRVMREKISNKNKTFFKKETRIKCYELNLVSVGNLYRLLFLLCSIMAASSISFGYLYCICLPYVFMWVPQLHNIKRALDIKKWQLLSLTLVLFSILWIYAIISFTFLYSFFDVNSNLYCSTLFECYITILRTGLLSSFAGTIPATLAGPNFNVFAWRAVIDVSYYLIITIIIIPIAIGIFSDGFSELNAKMKKIDQDQKDLCYVCGIKNEIFEKHLEGSGSSGFYKHTHEDHHVHSYIYYGIWVMSKPPKRRTAIERYVFDKINKGLTDFYPKEDAKDLEGIEWKKKD